MTETPYASPASVRITYLLIRLPETLPPFISSELCPCISVCNVRDRERSVCVCVCICAGVSVCMYSICVWRVCVILWCVHVHACESVSVCVFAVAVHAY